MEEGRITPSIPADFAVPKMEHVLTCCGSTATAGLGFVEWRNRCGLLRVCEAFNRTE